MAQKVLVQLVDDLNGSADGNVEVVRFGLDGVEYEIDLGVANAARLRDGLASFVASSRRVGGRAKLGAGVARARQATSSAGHSKEQSRAIREWAKANGHDLADRGRIKAKVITAFEAAHA